MRRLDIVPSGTSLPSSSRPVTLPLPIHLISREKR
jgi:hypothetical protein